MSNFSFRYDVCLCLVTTEGHLQGKTWSGDVGNNNQSDHVLAGSRLESAVTQLQPEFGLGINDVDGSFTFKRFYLAPMESDISTSYIRAGSRYQESSPNKM